MKECLDALAALRLLDGVAYCDEDGQLIIEGEIWQADPQEEKTT